MLVYMQANIGWGYIDGIHGAPYIAAPYIAAPWIRHGFGGCPCLQVSQIAQSAVATHNRCPPNAQSLRSPKDPYGRARLASTCSRDVSPTGSVVRMHHGPLE